MLDRLDTILSPLTWLVAAALVLMLFVGPEIVAEDKPQSSGTEAAGAAPYASSAAADGEQLFKDTCGSCHALEKAQASGAVGPDLTSTDLDAAAIGAIVESGSGAMPSFSGQLSQEEIDAIAAYVAGG